MPFTPFHLGPALLIGLRLFHFLDLFSLLVGSVIVDLEPLYLLTQNAPHLHGFFHSYLGASILAVPLAIVAYVTRDWVMKILEWFHVGQRSSFWQILLSSLSGAWSHVFLDSFLYGEMKPFYPLDFNPFLNAVPAFAIYWFCGISLLLGIVSYFYSVARIRKTGKSVARRIS